MRAIESMKPKFWTPWGFPQNDSNESPAPPLPNPYYFTPNPQPICHHCGSSVAHDAASPSQRTSTTAPASLAGSVFEAPFYTQEDFGNPRHGLPIPPQSPPNLLPAHAHDSPPFKHESSASPENENDMLSSGPPTFGQTIQDTEQAKVAEALVSFVEIVRLTIQAFEGEIRSLDSVLYGRAREVAEALSKALMEDVEGLMLRFQALERCREVLNTNTGILDDDDVDDFKENVLGGLRNENKRSRLLHCMEVLEEAGFEMPMEGMKRDSRVRQRRVLDVRFLFCMGSLT